MQRPLRLALVSTHPIQYYAPLYRALAATAAVELRVFYTWSQSADGIVFDPQFGHRRCWDVPLLDGYCFEFVPNVAREPGSHHFQGVVNPTLSARIAAWRADAVLVQGWNLQSHLATMRHFHGRIPVLFRGDSTVVDPVPPLRRALRRAWLQWVYRHIDVALAVGSHSRDYFLWAGVPDERIVVAPHTIDTLRFIDPGGAADARAAQWREELGIPPDCRVALFAAKLMPVKDPLLLLEAFDAVADSGARLVFAGSGELEAVLRRRIQGHPRAMLLPFQNQSAMPALYRVGDVFVLPSRGPETWGLAVNEALASGRPVISGSRVGATRDLISHGLNGWQFESRDCASLAAALRAALSLDRAALAAMGQIGRATIAVWTAEAVAGLIAETVRRLVATAQLRSRMS